MILIAILLWLQSFLSHSGPTPYFESHEMPFYTIVRRMAGGNIFLERIFAFTMLIATSLYLIQLNTKHILIKYRTYLPTLLFIVLSSSFLPLQRINPGIFAAFFMILAIDNLFSAYESSKTLDHLFKAGMFVAIASLFYFPAIFFLGLVIISLFILRSVAFRNWVVSLFGFITPWFLVLFYFYFFHDNLNALQSIISFATKSAEFGRFYGIAFTLFYSYSGFLLIIATLYLIGVFPTQKISARKFYSIFLWFILFAFIIVFFVGFSSIEIIYIAAIPTSFIIGNQLTFTRNKFWPEFFFTFLAIFAVLMQFI